MVEFRSGLSVNQLTILLIYKKEALHYGASICLKSTGNGFFFLFKKLSLEDFKHSLSTGILSKVTDLHQYQIKPKRYPSLNMCHF